MSNFFTQLLISPQPMQLFMINFHQFTHSNNDTRAKKPVLTLKTSDAGIPALRKLPCGVGRRYAGGTVCQRQASDADIPALFSNAYWHLNARVKEIQTRQQLKNNFSHEIQRIFLNKFCIWTHLAANVRVRCSDFSKLRAVYSNRHPPSLLGEHCEILRWQTLRKTLKR